jgi:hypothetical protein
VEFEPPLLAGGRCSRPPTHDSEFELAFTVLRQDICADTARHRIVDRATTTVDRIEETRRRWIRHAPGR